MGKRVIRLGDPTSHGGEVVSASATFNIMGKNVARVGDYVTCPKKGHHNCQIVEGDPFWTIDGRNVALEGHKVSCGAALISTLGNLIRSWEGDGAAKNIADFSSVNGVNGRHSTSDLFDEQVKLIVQGDTAYMAGIPFYIETSAGRVYSGHLGRGGELPRIQTEGPDVYTIYWGDDALERMGL